MFNPIKQFKSKTQALKFNISQKFNLIQFVKCKISMSYERDIKKFNLDQINSYNLTKQVSKHPPNDIRDDRNKNKKTGK